MPSPRESSGKRFSTKKCYECLTHLPLQAKVCTACKARVGPADRNGIAKKPVDWRSYAVFAVALAVLVGFIWKAFF